MGGVLVGNKSSKLMVLGSGPRRYQRHGTGGGGFKVLPLFYTTGAGSLHCILLHCMAQHCYGVCCSQIKNESTGEIHLYILIHHR
jgi:hypothetical protein